LLTNDGLGLNDGQRTTPIGPSSLQENPEQSIPVLDARALISTAENLELMTDGDVLEDQRFAGAKRPSDQV
jgi:hypothetical protein